MGIWGIFLFSLNTIFPTQSDDLGAGFGGLQGAIHAFMTWNARFGNLLLVSYMAGLAPTIYFSILNTLVGTIFVYVFFLLIFARKPSGFDDMVILALIMLCLMCHSAFGELFLWAAGALNYTWGYLIIALSLLPYRLFWDKHFHALDTLESKPKSIFLTRLYLVLFFIVSFIAGLSSEVLGIIIIFLHVCGFIYIKIKHVRLPLWYYAGFVGITLGWLTLYFSPGPAMRLNYVSGYLSIAQLFHLSIFELLQRTSNVFNSFMRPALFTLVAICLIIVINERIKAGISKLKILYFFIGMGFIIATFIFFSKKYSLKIDDIIYTIMILSFLFYFYRFYLKRSNTGYYNFLSSLFYKMFIIIALYFFFSLVALQIGIPGRAKFGHTLFLIFGIIIMYLDFLKFFGGSASDKGKRLQYIILCMCAIIAIFVASAYIHGRIKWDRMLDSIEMQKSEGKVDIVVDSNTFKSFYWHYGGWGNPNGNPNDWPNTAYAKYFHVRSFCAK